MKKLNDILQNVNIISSKGEVDIDVHALQLDSRVCKKGDMFFAIKGFETDGHNYIAKAVDLGAAVVVCETLPTNLDDSVTYIQVANSSIACGLVAANFYNSPSNNLKLVGVTGTNGKSTCVHLLYSLFTSMGINAGQISTIENCIAGEVIKSTHTTPNPIELQKLLAKMVDTDCEYAFMEVSSHAIHQERIAGVNFAGGLFTNISHDHLDYHKDFDEYISVKKKFFDDLPKGAFAISNLDDKRGGVMLQNTKALKQTFSLRTVADFKAKILENNLSGLILSIDNQEVHFKLIGEFNAYNLLSVYSIARCLDFDKIETLQHLSAISGAAGRFETIQSTQENIMGIVDYAHTPDALKNVLATINKLRNGNETVHSIVGCGGDRDKTKRPLMAHVACEHSDKVIFTSDNPRTENPEAILEEMEAGVPVHLKKKYLTITNRKEAIKAACGFAQTGDIILIAGKGHETYQEINGERFDFDDKKILQDCFKLMEK